MKRFILILLAIVMLIGCGAGVNTGRSPQLVTVPQPGNPQPFDLFITNNSQVDIAIGSLSSGFAQTLIIPPGDTVDIQIGFLPAWISVDAQTVTVPVYTFPNVTLTLGQQYNNFSTSVSVSFP